MGIKQLEAAILAELREVANNKKILQRDIQEWSTGEVKAQKGETLFHLPKLNINVAIRLTERKGNAKENN